MSSVRSYQDLLVWQQAMDLAVAIYETTRTWPKDELYGITSQARRAAVSVCANIAEGYGRDTRPAFVQFLRIAQGSIRELETHLMIAQRIELSPPGKLEDLIGSSASVAKLLRLLVRKLESQES
jgi:four helix bundle protein